MKTAITPKDERYIYSLIYFFGQPTKHELCNKVHTVKHKLSILNSDLIKGRHGMLMWTRSKSKKKWSVGINL